MDGTYSTPAALTPFCDRSRNTSSRHAPVPARTSLRLLLAAATADDDDDVLLLLLLLLLLL